MRVGGCKWLDKALLPFVGFVVGQAGLLQSFAMFLVAYFIITMTVLSICAISTNGALDAGGAYCILYCEGSQLKALCCAVELHWPLPIWQTEIYWAVNMYATVGCDDTYSARPYSAALTFNINAFWVRFPHHTLLELFLTFMFNLILWGSRG